MLVAMLDDTEYLDFWKDVYSFDMTHMQRKAEVTVLLNLKPETLNSEPCTPNSEPCTLKSEP